MEDQEVIRLVEGNLARIAREEARRADRDAKRAVAQRRADLARDRLAMNSLPAGLLALGCDMAMDSGMLGRELGIPAIILAVLYIGISLGRYSKEAR